jgi:hypothetical protein
MNIPGMVVLHNFKSTIRTLMKDFSLNQEIVFGILLWHFTFIIGSILFDAAGFNILLWFNIFTVLSCGILLFNLFDHFRSSFQHRFRIKDNTKITLHLVIKLHFSYEDLVYGIAIIFNLLLIAYIALCSFFEPILTNWDAVATYLPIAKSILLTGSMKGDVVYAPGVMARMPPLVPLMYAWVMFWSSSIVATRFIPIVYLLLDTLVIYEIGRMLIKNKYSGIIASTLYLTMPSTQYLFIKEGLYLEPALTFYLMTSIYGALMILRTVDVCDKDCEENKPSSLTQMVILFMAMSLGLSALTKEIGIVLGFFIYAIFIVHITQKRSLLILVTYFPMIIYYLLEVKSLLPGIEKFPNIMLLLITEFGVLIMFLTASYVMNKVFPYVNYVNKVNSKIRHHEVICMFLPLFLASTFYMYNVLFYRIITPHHLGVEDIFQEKLASYGLVYQYNPEISISRYVAFDKAFLSLFGGGTLIPPLILGCVTLYRKKEYHMYVIFLYLVFNLCIWSLYLKCPYSGHNYRFLYYLTLPIILLSTYGIASANNRHQTDMIGKALATVITLLINMISIWVLFTNGETAPSKVLLNLSFREPSIMDISVLCVPWLIFNSTEKIVNSRWNNFKLRKIFLIAFFVFVIMIPSCLINYEVRFVNSWINKGGPNEMDSAIYISPYYNSWIEVADYYKKEVIDNYTTLSYGCEIVRLFVNKPFLNMQLKDELLEVAPSLIDNNVTNTVENLYEKNIKYILIPKYPDDILKFYTTRSLLLKGLYDQNLRFNFTETAIADSLTINYGNIYFDAKEKRILQNEQMTMYYHTNFQDLNEWEIYGMNRATLDYSRHVNGSPSLRIDDMDNNCSGIYKNVLPSSGEFYLTILLRVEGKPSMDEVGLFFYISDPKIPDLVVAFCGNGQIEVRNYRGEKCVIGSYSFYEWYNIRVDFDKNRGKVNVYIFNLQNEAIASIENFNISNKVTNGISNGKLLLYSGLKFIGSSFFNNLTIYEKSLSFYAAPGFKVSFLDEQGNILFEKTDDDWDGKITLSPIEQSTSSLHRIVLYIPTYVIKRKVEFTIFIMFEIQKIV